MAEQPLQDAAYATMALHQRLTLAEIAAGARDHSFPARDLQAPNWFAAAAGSGSRLAEVAPELAVEETPGATDRLDLIRMYAPELQVDDVESAPQPATEPAAQGKGLRLELLQALSDLDE